MRLSSKQNLNLALKEAFHLFTHSIPQLPVSPVLGLYFQCLSLSLAFPLSIYCYILAESAAGRTQGDSITQRPRSRELGGTCGSSSCADPFLYINHCADLLPTGACMSIWRERAEIKTSNSLCRNPLACLPNCYLLAGFHGGQSPGNENGGETLYLK